MGRKEREASLQWKNYLKLATVYKILFLCTAIIINSFTLFADVFCKTQGLYISFSAFIKRGDSVEKP